MAANKLVQILVVKDVDDQSGLLPVVTVHSIGRRAKSLYNKGVRAVKLFVRETERDPTGIVAERDGSLCGQALRALKDAEPRMAVITETCICSATGGPCVIVDDKNRVNISLSHERFSNIALMQARNGADILGPAAMLDGSTAVVRRALDANSFHDVAIMPHVEFRSNLYSMYRRVAGTGSGIHRHGFQIEVDQGDQFIESASLMASEGADMLLVEPGLFALDMVTRTRDATRKPTGVFSVSGEYVMFMSLGEADRVHVMTEYVRSAFRAGGSFVAAYFAEYIADAKLDEVREC